MCFNIPDDVICTMHICSTMNSSYCVVSLVVLGRSTLVRMDLIIMRCESKAGKLLSITRLFDGVSF